MLVRSVGWFIVVALAVGGIAHADTPPPDMHWVDRCVEIDNLHEFPDIALILAIARITDAGRVDGYVIEPNQCLQKAYKFDRFAVFWTTRSYLRETGLENLPLAESFRDPAANSARLGLLSREINPNGRYVDDTSSLVGERLVYSLRMTDDGPSLVLSQQVCHYERAEPEPDPDEPPRAELTSWSASSLPEGLLLEWSPAAPESFSSFFLSRWQGTIDDETNATIIGDGAIQPADDGQYRLLDQTANGGCHYYYRLTGILKSGGELPFSPPLHPVYNLVSPWQIRLSPPRPNPSRGSVTFSVYAPQDATWDLIVVDVTGAVIHGDVPVSPVAAGTYRAEWNGRREDGRPVGPGVYYARARMAGQAATRSIRLIR